MGMRERERESVREKTNAKATAHPLTNNLESEHQSVVTGGQQANHTKRNSAHKRITPVSWC